MISIQLHPSKVFLTDVDHAWIVSEYFNYKFFTWTLVFGPPYTISGGPNLSIHTDHRSVDVVCCYYFINSYLIRIMNQMHLPWIKNCHKSSFHALRWRMYQKIKKLFWITGWRAWWISVNVFFNTWLVKYLTVLIIVSLWSFLSQNFNTVCRQWLLPSCIFVLKMLKSKILRRTSCVNNLFRLGLRIIKSKYAIFQADLLRLSYWIRHDL